MLFMVVLVALSFFFKIERVAQVEIFWSEGQPFLRCGLSEFSAIQKLDTFSVTFESKNWRDIVVYCKKASLEGDNITIPLVVIDIDTNLPIKDEFEFKGFVMVEKSTLTSKLFEKAKLRGL
jgi:hypothetical protein